MRAPRYRKGRGGFCTPRAINATAHKAKEKRATDPLSEARNCRRLTLQSLSSLSSDAVTRKLASDENLTARTVPECACAEVVVWTPPRRETILEIQGRNQALGASPNCTFVLSVAGKGTPYPFPDTSERKSAGKIERREADRKKAAAGKNGGRLQANGGEAGPGA